MKSEGGFDSKFYSISSISAAIIETKFVNHFFVVLNKRIKNIQHCQTAHDKIKK